MQSHALLETTSLPHPLVTKRACVALNGQLLLDGQLGREAPSRVQVLAHQSLHARDDFEGEDVCEFNGGRGSCVQNVTVRVVVVRWS